MQAQQEKESIRAEAPTMAANRSGAVVRAEASARRFVLRGLAGRQRVIDAALAAAGLAATWGAVFSGGHLGRGAGVQIAFAAAMVVFALEEALRSPAVTGEAASPETGGRSPGLGTLACMAGALLGPAVAEAALGAGWVTSVLTTLAVACSGASIAARRLSRYLPPVASRVPAANDRGLAPGGRIPAANERNAEANERIATASERVAAMSERRPAAGVRGLAGARGSAA